MAAEEEFKAEKEVNNSVDEKLSELNSGDEKLSELNSVDEKLSELNSGDEKLSELNSVDEKLSELNSVDEKLSDKSFCLRKFRLYETPSNYYMIGRDKSRLNWRVLKIDRTEASELNILEDPTTYTEIECFDLLRRIHEGNKGVGGLKFVTVCYGIIGFVRFLGPYYMLIVTKRRKVGTIFGHTIYGVSKSKMMPVPNSDARAKLPYFKDENRYKKLLCTVDLTKDFYFSYSYPIMRCLQKNVTDYKEGLLVYETMFVWNEYLTRDIRNSVNNTLWTVALMYGFFKQVDLSVSGKIFKFILIARRSRHYAGTRYLKRGVNEKGRVANDVETEQIVIYSPSPDCRMQFSSVVQIRGSIPLFWSQDTSRIVVKPDILLLETDKTYVATRLHFENLVKRYGNPITILNLIKTNEKKPRETILRSEFENAVQYINFTLEDDNRLRFFQWDLHKHSRIKAVTALEHLVVLAAKSLTDIGLFHCQVAAKLRQLEYPNLPSFEQKDNGDCISDNLSSHEESVDNVEQEIFSGSCHGDATLYYSFKPLSLQRGVLRTNCIDCLDRTNVAQYAFGLVSLGRQLHASGLMESPGMGLEHPLSNELMALYETMGDTLALQYGGSAAHNKIFSERRGQWKPATQSQELFRTVQRYYNNAYLDREKQDSINVFLGHFQPQPGKPALWDLDSDQQYKFMRRDSNLAEEDARLIIKRSLSDGNIPCESDSPMADKEQKFKEGLSDSSPQIRTCEHDSSCCRYTPTLSRKQFLKRIKEEQSSEMDRITFDDHEGSNLSSFMDSGWLSSSGNSCEEEGNGRSPTCSMENASNGIRTEVSEDASKTCSHAKENTQTQPDQGQNCGDSAEFPESFVNWVSEGSLLFF